MPVKSRLKPEPPFKPKLAISEARTPEIACLLPSKVRNWQVFCRRLPEPAALEPGQLRQRVKAVKALSAKKGGAKEGSGLRKLLCLPPARSQGLDEAWIHLASSHGRLSFTNTAHCQHRACWSQRDCGSTRPQTPISAKPQTLLCTGL